MKINVEYDLDKHIDEIREELFKRIHRVDFRKLKNICILNPILQKRQIKMNCPSAAEHVARMLCIALRILARSSYLDVRWPCSVAIPKSFVIFEEKLKALNDVLPSIKFPATEE